MDSEPFKRMQCAVTTLLRCIGEDPEREGLVDTPKVGFGGAAPTPPVPSAK